MIHAGRHLAVAAALLAAAALPIAPGRCDARARARAAATPATPASDPDAGLRRAGLDFEAARLLGGAARVEALHRVGESLPAPGADKDADARFAVRALDGALRYELGDYHAAAEAFGRAGEVAGRSPFAPDAEFGAIQALEASGDDAGAARAWSRWEKRFPESPLLPEARLAEARNALRRGETAAAGQALDQLIASAPWMQTDPRVRLARGLTLYLGGRPAEAIAALGPRRALAGGADNGSAWGAAATYLAALCSDAQGSRLKAAALFQETAERFPDSPLRDHALLAKANAFLASGDHRSAAEEFARVAQRVSDPAVRAEAELRAAGALFLAGDLDSSLVGLRDVAARHAGTDVAARAQFLVGEVLMARGEPAKAIVELNRVLTTYFRHAIAASAQYQVARCLDRMGRGADATSAYQAVVSGYPLEPEAPAAAYLAGVGLMKLHRPVPAAPYFQLVLDRVAARRDSTGRVAFATPDQQELTEAALCMLELAWHQAGNLGQLSGAPHLLLSQLPPSHSPWRAWAVLIDADASASQARYPEAQLALEGLTREFPDRPVGAEALQLLAWTYAREGRDSLAIACEQRLLERRAGPADPTLLAGALLDIAHERFNQKRYREAASAYEDFTRRYPDHPRRLEALYQCGLCYLRLDRAGDAVDRWEAIVRDSSGSALAERAFARMGDAYFEAEQYRDAKRSYQGLLEHFADSPAAALAMLRLAQCDYNAGDDAAALAGFSATIARFPDRPEGREARRGTELALYRLSQRPDGQQVLARLVEQFPASAFAADAQFQIARRDYQAQRWGEAADGFRRVVSGFPGYSAADQAQFLMADALVHANRPDEARSAYEGFASFFPGSPLQSMVQFRLGLLAFGAKDYTPAALAFTRVLDDSTSAEVRSASRYNLALCRRELGDTEAARAELEHHRAEFPHDERAADVADQLGDLDEAAGHSDEARAEYERALLEHPRPALAAEAGYRLGKVREQLGQAAAALAAYQQAAASGRRDDPYRLSAVARVAALCEKRHDYPRALAAYRDIARNASDHELAAAAAGRVAQLESAGRH